VWDVDPRKGDERRHCQFFGKRRRWQIFLNEAIPSRARTRRSRVSKPWGIYAALNMLDVLRGMDEGLDFE
jgi:hypothetical protein